eukprot:CAMPEP_0205931060 /NCGR_PEP_ID=MMETSP1325-20131115/26634_1 /ASSEMBLY_ACC=CAM_ASM_000708 /TAXON_ID=236786 /ORGANISM="Florenciella sp., Strain RCC1007" /LENGTH=63 /DNA_ID=CAMNT_0053300561 /DNA_START=1 /DNA_END=188 /DNA_ORIENTATION=-
MPAVRALRYDPHSGGTSFSSPKAYDSPRKKKWFGSPFKRRHKASDLVEMSTPLKARKPTDHKL